MAESLSVLSSTLINWFQKISPNFQFTFSVYIEHLDFATYVAYIMLYYIQYIGIT